MANKEHLRILKKGTLAWNKWRDKNPDIQPDLSMTFIPEQYRLKPYLRGESANRFGTQRIDMAKRDMRGINLRNTNLAYADLRGMLLHNADLYGATLTHAALHDTDFRGCNLGETNFMGALLWNTVFVNVNLSTARGLGECSYDGPCFIDHCTLISSGELPVCFLQGCGLSDTLIDYIPSLLNQPIQYYSCFISYTHSDKAFARRLHDQLQGRGIRVWLDEHQLLPGDDIFTMIDRGIKLWDKVLLCCSKSSLMESVWVNREINKALLKEEHYWQKHGEEVLAIIPLNLDDYLFQWKNGKASELIRRLAADFTGWDKNNAKFETQFEKVTAALRSDNGGRDKPPEVKL